jgi:hypothetical protein
MVGGRQVRTKSRRTDGASGRRGIQSIEVGLRIVEALTAAMGPQPLKALSQIANIPPSNCHRYLASFVRTGFVIQDTATGRYDLGPLAVRAGLAAIARLDPVATDSPRYRASWRRQQHWITGNSGRARSCDRSLVDRAVSARACQLVRRYLSSAPQQGAFRLLPPEETPDLSRRK